jgi:flagellar motility protein MotE (MotC chaperone)
LVVPWSYMLFTVRTCALAACLLLLPVCGGASLDGGGQESKPGAEQSGAKKSAKADKAESTADIRKEAKAGDAGLKKEETDLRKEGNESLKETRGLREDFKKADKELREDEKTLRKEAREAFKELREEKKPAKPKSAGPR